jgi:rare lipoprotein A
MLLKLFHPIKFLKSFLLLTCLTILIFIAFFNFGKIAAAITVTDQVAICTHHSERRIITIDYLSDSQKVPCQVIYEKKTEQPGHQEVLWRANNSVGYCERKTDDFIKKLTGYGWQCAYKKAPDKKEEAKVKEEINKEIDKKEEKESKKIDIDKKDEIQPVREVISKPPKIQPVSQPPKNDPNQPDNKPSKTAITEPAKNHEDSRFQQYETVALCRQGKSERIVALDYLIFGKLVPCKVIYDKQTQPPKVLWRANNSVGYCERKMSSFLKKLKGYGWKCHYEKQIDMTTVVATKPPQKTSPAKENSQTAQTPIIATDWNKQAGRKNYLAYCGGTTLNLAQPVTAIAQALSGLEYDSSKLQDCSGIFHQLVNRFQNEYCPNYHYPPLNLARHTRGIAKWYHQRGELILIDEPHEKSQLIKPGAVMFYGYQGKTYQNFTAEDLFIPGLGINHIGVVVAVIVDDQGQVANYKLFHGRRPGYPSQITEFHWRKPAQPGYPPYGNGQEQWVAIAPLVTQPYSSQVVYIEEGEASYYADSLHGNLTASGKPYDKNELTAAHQTLSFGSRARVTYFKTGKVVEVTINDRGPFYRDRIIDLSRRAAEKLGLIIDGYGDVKIEVTNH